MLYNCVNKGVIKVGDRAKIINRGNHYSSYHNMASLMKARFWKPNPTFCEGVTGEVKNIESHEAFQDTKIALLRLGRIEILIGLHGLLNIELCKTCKDKLRCVTNG